MTALWLVSLIGSPDYDEYDGFVVRARDEASARALADALANDAGQRGVFTSSTRARCERLFVHGNETVVMSSFNAG